MINKQLFERIQELSITEEKKPYRFNISFDVNTMDAAKSLVGLIKMIKSMGDMGASRSIGVLDDKEWNSYGFDGDGADKIQNIEINGKNIDKKNEEEIKEIFKNFKT